MAGIEGWITRSVVSMFRLTAGMLRYPMCLDTFLDYSKHSLKGTWQTYLRDADAA
jgi:hypothetical protein